MPFKKRKLVAALYLGANLIFGKLQPSFSKTKELDSNFVHQITSEKISNDQGINSFDNTDSNSSKETHQRVLRIETPSEIILAKTGGNPVSAPIGGHPTSFPTGGTGGNRPLYVPPYRVSPPVSNQGLGAGVNPAGGDGDNGTTEFDDQCKASKDKEPKTRHHDSTEKRKKKKKKKRNEHLNRKVKVNGETFEFERAQVEKKAPSHGTDFGIAPEIAADGTVVIDRRTGKPRAKQNKITYDTFTDNVTEFIQNPKSERIETTYRKGRQNQRDVIGFRDGKKFTIFDKDSKKFITGWVMNDLQYKEYIENNNII